MTEARKPSPVKLFIGAIFSGEGVLIEAKERLKKKFGRMDFQSPVIPFNFTEYYEKEMGTDLKRQFFSFEKLIKPQQLPEIKLYTNRLEKGLGRKSASARQVSSLRSINLDPGYLCGGKLVLATCKDYSHRIYLDKGVYAEITLHFRDGAFSPWPWTYPDYKSQGYLKAFHKVREIYLKQLPS
jgi:hypothetical protein